MVRSLLGFWRRDTTWVMTDESSDGGGDGWLGTAQRWRKREGLVVRVLGLRGRRRFNCFDGASDIFILS